MIIDLTPYDNSKDPVLPNQPRGRWPDYAAYLRSDVWKEIREQVLLCAAGTGRVDEARCEVCHCDACDTCTLLQVHHIVYSRWGQEKFGELAVLCPLCHATVTCLLKEGHGRHQAFDMMFSRRRKPEPPFDPFKDFEL